LSVAHAAAPEVPTVDDLRKKLATLADQMNDLTGSGLGKVADQVRDRPLAVVLVALGIGLIGGYLLKR
jgi:ElaB/YqjD/DUF883 family membrane-anchored ribosome-binding protein